MKNRIRSGENLAVFTHKFSSTLRGLRPNKIKPNAWQRLGIYGPGSYAAKPSCEFADQRRGLFVHYSSYTRKHVSVLYTHMKFQFFFSFYRFFFFTFFYFIWVGFFKFLFSSNICINHVGIQILTAPLVAQLLENLIVSFKIYWKTIWKLIFFIIK